MKNKYKYILLIWIIFFSTESCIKEECKINGGEYMFIMPFTLTPAQKNYHIGDTIVISSNVSNPVYERVTKNYYTLEDFKFYLITSMYYMDTLINDYSDFNRFDLLIDSTFDMSIFTYSDGSSTLLGQYNYRNSQYSYEFKLIAKEKGRYLLTQGCDINYINGGQYFEGKCQNVEVNARFYMNGRADNNSDLLKEASNENFKLYLNHLDAQYLDYGGYCFKVID